MNEQSIFNDIEPLFGFEGELVPFDFGAQVMFPVEQPITEVSEPLALFPPLPLAQESVAEIRQQSVSTKAAKAPVRKPRRKMTPEEKEAKALERVLKNRQAAQESRDKKKEYLANLEMTNKTLLEQNKSLFQVLEKNEAEKRDLLALVKNLSAELDKLKRKDCVISNELPLSPDSDLFDLSSFSPRSSAVSSPASSPTQSLLPLRSSSTSHRTSPYAAPSFSTTTLADSSNNTWASLLVSDRNSQLKTMTVNEVKRGTLHSNLVSDTWSVPSSVTNSEVAGGALATLITSLSFLALGPVSKLYARNVIKRDTDLLKNIKFQSTASKAPRPTPRPFVHMMAGLRRRQQAGASRLAMSLGRFMSGRGRFVKV